MPELKNKRELADEAITLAASFEMIHHRSILYIPADFETGDSTVTPPVERKIWRPLTKQDLQIRAQMQFNTLFETPRSLDSFEFMVAQCAEQRDDPVTSLLVRTPAGLKELKEDGRLHDPNGDFVPNTLVPILNEDPEDIAFVLSVISEWLSSEEEARSLLRHLATSLAPGWSAVKYVLLLGEGRNGKSLLLTLLEHIFGSANCSHVTRQDISDKSPAVSDLNGKLLNLVYDGQAIYLKDSGSEKSLVAGESVGVRKLYASTLTQVQTNALFVEGLNREPRTSDKSSALQARIVRFHFPNVYALDQEFWKRMNSDRYLGAFLALLIQHYVKPSEVQVMLAPSKRTLELQLEHMFDNSLALQFFKHLEDQGTGTDSLLGQPIQHLSSLFQSWRIKQNDIRPWSEPDLTAMFKPYITTERKSIRTDEGIKKARVITGFSKDIAQFIQQITDLEGDPDAAAILDGD